MRILHFGDIHFWRLQLARDFYYPKRLLGIVNLAMRRRHHFPAQLAREAMMQIASEDKHILSISLE